MSDARTSQPSTPLPPASVDITELRRAVDAAAEKTGGGGQRVLAVAIQSVALLIVVIVVVVIAIPATDERWGVAIGATVLLIGVALIFVLPLQLARRRARAAIDAVAADIDAAAERLIRHLGSIGYSLPDDVALDWVTSPEPTATVPLVHDSVIAARWWRPAEDDDRVFVEAILRQGGQDAALPVLPAL